MKRMRVFGLVIAGLVIAVGAVAVFLLSCPHHQAYVHAQVSPNRTEAIEPPPELVRVRELGRVDRIRSEADALAYVRALPHAGILPPFTGFDEARLARAEYAAIRDPQKQIPESLVVKTWNALVDEWGGPASSHVTIEELRYYRGNLPPSDCRPTEALHLLSELQFNGGVSVPRFAPPTTVERLRDFFRRIFGCPRSMTAAQEDALRRLRQSQFQFSVARSRYFVGHLGITSRQLCDSLFDQLGIN